MPTDNLTAWGLELAARHLGSMPDRLNHSLCVARRAHEVRRGVEDPGRHLVAAALVHDLGYDPELRRTGMHAIDGASYLRSLGAPDEVVCLVAFHTGAEYEADERGLADELAAFSRPPQGLLDLLILADLTSSPTGSPISVEDRLSEIFTRYPSEHAVHRSVSRSREYLEGAASRALGETGQPM